MKSKVIFFIFLLLPIWVAVAVGSVAGENSGNLVVNVSGFEHQEGQAGMNLFIKQEDMFDKPYRQAFAKIENGKARIVLPDLPFGAYAIVVFHDENGNGKVDHNFFKFPSEPLAYPSGYAFGLTSGRPTFDKLRIRFESDLQTFSVVVE